MRVSVFAPRRRKHLFAQFLLTFSLLLFVLPVGWLLLMSVRPLHVMFGGAASIVSTEFTLEHYQTLFSRFNTLRFIGNSLVGAIMPALIGVSVGLLAAYAIVRFRFRGSALLQSMPLFAQVLPAVLLVVPMYSLMLFLGLLNTFPAIILAHTALVLPVTIWMLTGYVRSIPVELEEAAMVDGCDRLGAILRVVLPVGAGGVIATVTVAFIMAWGEFIFALVLLSGDDMRFMSIAVFLFVPASHAVTNFGLLFAASSAFMLPGVILFPLVQRLIARDLAAGSVQGF